MNAIQRPIAKLALLVLAAALPARAVRAEDAGPRVAKQAFGTTADDAKVDLYTLTNGRGLEARVMTLGATLVTVMAPDREGNVVPITLHKESLAEYVQGHPLLGSVVGRYANRIAGARFTLDGKEHEVVRNAGKHHIHGGGRKDGYAWRVWRARPVEEEKAAGVELKLTSPDGQAGFPGRLEVTVTYKLTTDNELVMDYRATTDKPTHVNLTNHAYWNLAGADSKADVLGHVLMLNADRYLATDKDLIPTGEIRNVKDTPMDFAEPKTIGSRMDQIERGYYDDCYVLNKTPGERMSLCAVVEEPQSGRVMEVRTTQPGVQLYTGNRRGLCLETQHYPDSPNKPDFPSTVLRPGKTYHEVTVHRFDVK